MRRYGWFLVIGAVLLACLLASPAARADVTPPGSDPFYIDSAPLASLSPGTILKSRSVTLSFAKDLSTPVSAEQLLYRTTNELGEPALAVTTVIRPLQGTSILPRIVSYQTAYDSLGPDCDPSYEFQGGSAGLSSTLVSGCDGLDQLEIAGASTFLAQGATIVIPDYEETNEAWAAGQLEGYATLDSLRATERYLGFTPASTPIGMIGYSGGAIPSQWAAELAPAYAPELDLVGTAAGGVLVDPYHNMLYVSNDGSQDWANVMPAVLLTIFGRAFGLDIDSYVSDYGAQLMNEDANGYVADLAGDNMTYQQLLQPQYADIGSIPVFAQDFNHLIMGADGTPDSPLLLANGEGTTNNGYDGDGVMITADVEALAHEYCSRGVPVEYQEFDGLTHEEAIASFEPAAIAYITQRLTGLPAPSNCASTGTGASLAPLPVASATSTGSTSATTTTTTAAAKAEAAAKAKAKAKAKAAAKAQAEKRARARATAQAKARAEKKAKAAAKAKAEKKAKAKQTAAARGRSKRR